MGGKCLHNFFFLMWFSETSEIVPVYKILKLNVSFPIDSWIQLYIGELLSDQSKN